MQKVFQSLLLFVAFSVVTEASSFRPRQINVPIDFRCLGKCYAQLVQDGTTATILGCGVNIANLTPACMCEVAQRVLDIDKDVCGKDCPVMVIQEFQNIVCALQLPTGA
ncbi:hypothetical protein CPB85DRAFT_1457286 [Mucidula mucida]|nr:hypothetical protein CPB85DRAFT_1457286 [Mucidula mucida]